MKFSLVIQHEREIATVLTRLREMIREGRRVSVKAELEAAKRTHRQGNTVHGWFGEIAQQSGHDHDTIKEVLKMKFAKKELVNIGDIEVLRPISTKDMSKRQMNDFMTQIQAWAAEFGFVLRQPEPDMLRAWRIEAEQEQAA